MITTKMLFETNVFSVLGDSIFSAFSAYAWWQWLMFFAAIIVFICLGFTLIILVLDDDFDDKVESKNIKIEEDNLGINALIKNKVSVLAQSKLSKTAASNDKKVAAKVDNVALKTGSNFESASKNLPKKPTTKEIRQESFDRRQRQIAAAPKMFNQANRLEHIPDRGHNMVHVTCSQGKWKIKSNWYDAPFGIFDTKQQAVDAAREIAKTLKSELVIHRIDGVIAESMSYGKEVAVVDNSNLKTKKVAKEKMSVAVCRVGDEWVAKDKRNGKIIKASSNKAEVVSSARVVARENALLLSIFGLDGKLLNTKQY